MERCRRVKWLVPLMFLISCTRAPSTDPNPSSAVSGSVLHLSWKYFHGDQESESDSRGFHSAELVRGKTASIRYDEDGTKRLVIAPGNGEWLVFRSAELSRYDMFGDTVDRCVIAIGCRSGSLLQKLSNPKAESFSVIVLRYFQEPPTWSHEGPIQISPASPHRNDLFEFGFRSKPFPYEEDAIEWKGTGRICDFDPFHSLIAE